MRQPMALLCLCLPLCAQTVWWEGEAAEATNFNPRSDFEAAWFETAGELLSGGSWLASSGPRAGEEVFARWSVEVPEGGRYQLWCRKFWKHGPFRWRFGKQAWQTCPFECGLEDNVVLATHICANWVHLGEVELAAGTQSFELRLLAGPGEATTACFDAFCLSDGSFAPRGRLRPGERSGEAAPGWFAFEPPAGFAQSPIDLRYLNEREAGEHGFVSVEEGRFLRGDGEPLRVMGVNVGPAVLELSRNSQRDLARRLARNGVNGVRIHSPVFDREDPREVDAERLDQIHFLVSVLKEQGIYSSLSFYFPIWLPMRGSYGFEGYSDGQTPFSLLLFDEDMQALHRGWARELLSSKNPYTGRSLARDPAVMLVELQNEDSFFFWTFGADALPEPYLAALEQKFGAWLKARHGSWAKAQRSWSWQDQARDDPARGRATLLDAWHMTADGLGDNPAKRRRMADQVRFLAETQRAFYEDTARTLRRKLKVRCPIVCSNWITADARLLDPIERWTYTAADVQDHHAYFGGRHEGDGAGYSVRVGHSYEDRSALFEPWNTPFTTPLSEEQPEIFSEIGWPHPNRFTAEFPFLCAAYGSLHGIDAWFLFALDGAHWDSALQKFPFYVPSIFGQLPALALAYRRGDIAEGAVVRRERLDEDELFALQGSALQAARNLDALREPDGGQQGASGPEPLASLTGKVVQTFGRGRPVQTDLRDLIEREARRVRSASGELLWDARTGLVTVDTPRFQAVCGFLAEAGEIELGDVRIRCENEYAAIAVISLDGLPLASSRKVLVQAVTEDRPYGFEARGGRISELGGYPLNVREIEAEVRFGRARFRTAWVLDGHGQPRELVAEAAVGEALPPSYTLPSDGLYSVLGD